MREGTNCATATGWAIVPLSFSSESEKRNARAGGTAGRFWATGEGQTGGSRPPGTVVGLCRTRKATTKTPCLLVPRGPCTSIGGNTGSRLRAAWLGARADPLQSATERRKLEPGRGGQGPMNPAAGVSLMARRPRKATDRPTAYRRREATRGARGALGEAFPLAPSLPLTSV